MIYYIGYINYLPVQTLTSIYNGYNEDGYQLPNTTQTFTIIGGAGAYLNVKGTVVVTTPDYSNLTEYYEKYVFNFE